jgi:hypothetical protein
MAKASTAAQSDPTARLDKLEEFRETMMHKYVPRIDHFSWIIGLISAGLIYALYQLVWGAATAHTTVQIHTNEIKTLQERTAAITERLNDQVLKLTRDLADLARQVPKVYGATFPAVEGTIAEMDDKKLVITSEGKSHTYDITGNMVFFTVRDKAATKEEVLKSKPVGRAVKVTTGIERGFLDVWIDPLPSYPPLGPKPLPGK